jgi:signal transduction histidine kinase
MVMLISNEPPEPDLIRSEILANACDQLCTRNALLFELSPGGTHYRPETLPSDRIAFDYHVSPKSLLIRWLRTNGIELLIPDRIGVFDALPPDEQAALQRMRLTACIPLVHARMLEAFVALDCESAAAHPGRLRQATLQAPAWAARLSDAKARWRARREAETSARSNRLTVTGQLAASIAHEVRNPLAAIRSTVQLVRDHEASVEDQHTLLTNVLNEVDRITLVLKHMLTSGRVRTPNYEACDLVPIADEAIQFLRGYSRPQDQRIERIGVDQLLVFGDPHELRQTLVNLLLNACQASPRGARIVIETVRDSSHGDHAVVTVKDNGCGIPADQVTKVFEPFYSTKVDGGGLGLGICREIIERHGGRIELASQPGHGTTMTIRLPIEHATRTGC